MQKLKKIIKIILQRLCVLVFPELKTTPENIPVLTTLKCGVIQKIFRINAHVPWPVHWTSQIREPSKIKRGTRFPGLSLNCYIDARNGILIGKNTWIGPRVSLISMNHDIENFNNYIKTTPIIIGANCWIAANATLLPGVELGDHTVVAAGAVVNKSFPSGNQIIGGVPAKVIQAINPYAPSEK